MVAYSFNAQQFQPQYGGAGGLPAGPNGENVKYKVVIVNSYGQNSDSGQGGYLAFELTPIEGPFAGQKMTDRLNLHHTNPKVVEIANKQLSAYCHVLGRFQFQQTEELHQIPFIVEVGLQKEPNPNKYTEVKALFDINGNEPGKAGSGPQPQSGQQQPQGQPAAGVQPGGNGGGWGGQQQPQIDSNVGMPGGQGQQQPQQQPQGQGGAPAWGGQGQGQPQGDQGQQQPQGGGQAGWGGGGQQQPQQQPQQGGWGQQQPQGQQGGGAPGWGPR